MIFQNLTVIPSIHHPDKQSILFEIAAFDRGMIVNYQFYNFQDKLIANYSTGLLRNVITIPDITLPRYTRRIVSCFITKLTLDSTDNVPPLVGSILWFAS